MVFPYGEAGEREINKSSSLNKNVFQIKTAR